MFAVLSNYGDWESDMVGTVGIVNSREDFLSFCEEHVGEGVVVRMTNCRDAIVDSFDDNQFSVLCDGHVVEMIEFNGSDFYYLAEF